MILGGIESLKLFPIHYKMIILQAVNIRWINRTPKMRAYNKNITYT